MINDEREKTRKEYEEAKKKYTQVEEQRDIALGRRDKARKKYHQFSVKQDGHIMEHLKAQKAYKQDSVLLKSIQDRIERTHEERSKFYNVLKIIEKEHQEAVLECKKAAEHRDWTEAKHTIAIDRYNEDKEARDGIAA